MVDLAPAPLFNDAVPFASINKELVLVPDGIGYKIRQLQELMPQFCWKYLSTELLLLYEFNVAAKTDQWKITCKSKEAKLSSFYGYLPPSLFSPIDFHVIPKALLPVAEKIDNDINSPDNIALLTSFDNSMIFPGAPCIARRRKDGGKYGRAQLKSVPASTGLTHVLFVDSGETAFVDCTDIHPLPSKFARVPPLAIHCRMRGVVSIDLYMSRLEAFQELMSSLDYLVRVEMTTGATFKEPYLVNLYHPTIANINLGEGFHCSNDPYGIANVASSETTAVDDNSSDQSSDDDEDDMKSKKAPPKSLFRYQRLTKPWKGRNRYTCVHVENARLVYMKTDGQVAATTSLESRLSLTMDELTETMPSRLLFAGTACAMRESTETDSRWIRALITDRCNNLLSIQSIDYGQKFTLRLDDSNSAKVLKPLPRAFDQPPLMHVFRIDGLCDDLPWYTETIILRRLLPTGRRVMVEVFKGSFTHGAPYRAAVFLSKHSTGNCVEESVVEETQFENLADVMKVELAKSYNKRSSSLVPFVDAPIRALQRCLLNNFPVNDCSYETRLSQFLLKGNLEYADFV